MIISRFILTISIVISFSIPAKTQSNMIPLSEFIDDRIDVDGWIYVFQRCSGISMYISALTQHPPNNEVNKKSVSMYGFFSTKMFEFAIFRENKTGTIANINNLLEVISMIVDNYTTDSDIEYARSGKRSSDTMRNDYQLCAEINNTIE